MNLEEASAYEELVNKPSTESAELLRVNPESPDDSYLLHKLEGRHGISGSRMPLAMTPLSESELELVRRWIAGGARR